MAAKIKATLSTLIAVLVTNLEVTAKKTDRLFKPAVRTCEINSSSYRVELCICMGLPALILCR